MSGEPTIIGLLAIAVAVGLVGSFVVWVVRRVTDEKTRTQVFLGAAVAVAFLVVGIFFARTSVHQQATVVPPVPAQYGHPVPVHGTHAHAQVASTENGSISAESSMTVEHGARMEIHAGSSNSEPAHVYFHQGTEQFAWGPLAVITLAAGGILLVIVSKRNLPAALTGLGIIGGLVLFYKLSERTVAVPEIRSSGTAQLDHKNWDSSGTYIDDSSENGAWSGSRPERPVSPSAPPPVSAPDSEKESVSEPVAESNTSAEKKNGEVKAEHESATNDDTNDDKSNPIKNEPRPSWVDAPPSMEAGIYKAVVVSGPYSTALECDNSLIEPLRDEVMNYANRYLPPPTRYYAWADMSYLRNLIEERYSERVKSQYITEPMWKLHVLVKIDPNDVAHFESVAHEARVHEAVAETSAGAACLLGVLAVVYGCLRFKCCKKPPAPQPATTETTA
jgi:hypothetical protein